MKQIKEMIKTLSLAPRSLRHKLMVAFALMSVLPLLITGYLVFSYMFFVTETPLEITLMVLLGVVLSLMGFYLARGITLAILKLAVGAKSLADGALTEEIAMDREDEIGQLGESLNKMREGLYQSIAELHSHEERTEQLNMEIKELLGRIEALSVTDQVTGVYNEKYLRERLREEIERAVIHQRPCSLILLYVDSLDECQKELGEKAVHLILKKFAGIIQEGAGAIAKVARSGESEFAVILPEKNKREAYDFAERIREEVEHFDFPLTEHGVDKKITLSGMVVGNPIDGISGEELMRKATEGLQVARERSNNQVLMYQE